MRFESSRMSTQISWSTQLVKQTRKFYGLRFESLCQEKREMQSPLKYRHSPLGSPCRGWLLEVRILTRDLDCNIFSFTILYMVPLISVIQLVAGERNVLYRNTILELKNKQEWFKVMTWVYTPSRKIKISLIHSLSVLHNLIIDFQKWGCSLRNKHMNKFLGIEKRGGITFTYLISVNMSINSKL